MTKTNDYKQRGEELGRRSRERRANEEEKICPFSFSNPNGPANCSPKCKLYRKEPKGYECTFQELRSISWNTNKKNQSSRKTY